MGCIHISKTHLNIIVHAHTVSNLFTTLVHFPALELLEIQGLYEEDALLPVPAGSIALLSLRLRRFECDYDQDKEYSLY